jgi:arylsulfatase A-like enzyme/cytochrome c-type biogenesis protein CcmH/NrfG
MTRKPRPQGRGFFVVQYAPQMKRLLVLVLILFACSPRETKTHVYANAPVIIISIDTLRADHLPAYGYKSVDTPNIDRFRRDATLFENAYSHVPLTLPSHISMLTGALPPDNGVRNNIGYLFDASKHETIPSLLHEHGYATGAAISAYVLRGSTGIRNAFDFYDDAVEVRGGEAQGELQRNGNTTAAIAERWIGEQGDRPFFFLLHVFEPHSPYTPPEPYKSRYASSPYDGEIATADAIVGQFIDDLKQKKIYDRAVIVLMSDHGEGLNDHGEAEHGIFLYREELHVPLMLKLPNGDQANRSVTGPVGLIDIFPTIAALTGVTPPATLRGQSLLAPAAHRSLYSETLYPRIHLGWSDLRSLIDDGHHYIQAPHPELFDFKADAAERNNILERERRIYASMRQSLDAYGSEMQAPSNIDPEEAKKLAALGYLSAAVQASGPLPDPKDRIGELNALHQAARREDSGDVAGAISDYKRILAENPNFADAWGSLARAQVTTGDYDGAIESYKRAIQVAPMLSGGNALQIASLSLNLGKLDDAEKNAHLAERMNPVEAHVMLGRVAMARHDFARAETEARAAIALKNDDPHAQVLLAQVLTNERRYDEAMGVLDAVAPREAQQPVALADFVRGDLLARMGHPEEGEVAFRREIEHFPAETQAYANLAALLWFEGRRDEARQTMAMMVQKNPRPDARALAAKTIAELSAQR